MFLYSKIIEPKLLKGYESIRSDIYQVWSDDNSDSPVFFNIGETYVLRAFCMMIMDCNIKSIKANLHLEGADLRYRGQLVCLRPVDFSASLGFMRFKNLYVLILSLRSDRADAVAWLLFDDKTLEFLGSYIPRDNTGVTTPHVAKFILTGAEVFDFGFV